jgi:hypothetical protein
MRKYYLWSGILSLPLGSFLVIIGAFKFVNHQEAASFFRGGIILMISGSLFCLLALKKLKQSS